MQSAEHLRSHWHSVVGSASAAEKDKSKEKVQPPKRPMRG